MKKSIRKIRRTADTRPAADATSPAAMPTPAPRDRAAEFLASIGLNDTEIVALKETVAILPWDEEIIGRARAFVSLYPQGWNHEQWAGFVRELDEAGYAIRVDETHYMARRFVGILLETLRKQALPAAEKSGVGLLRAA